MLIWLTISIIPCFIIAIFAFWRMIALASAIPSLEEIEKHKKQFLVEKQKEVIDSKLLEDLKDALTSLGFKKTEIKELILWIPNDLKTLEEMVTFVLKNYRGTN